MAFKRVANAHAFAAAWAMSDYPLGETDRELERLGFQHEVWASATTALWDRASYRPGQRIADLGAGPGYATLALARRVGPNGEIISVDASRRSLDQLQERLDALGQRNVRLEHSDVGELSLEEDSLDGAFARWLFCFVSKPESLVERLAGWVKPGGVVTILDYFHYETFALAPRVPVMEAVVAAVIASWRQGGGDLDIAGRLPAMFEKHGFEIDEVTPTVHCARPGTALWEWPHSFFRGYLDTLVERQLLSAKDAAEFRATLETYARTPSCFMLTPPVIAIRARRR